MTKSENKIITIYVYPLDEGVDVWRPTQALVLGNDRYKLLPTPDYDPEDEVWEFLPESTVIGEMKERDSGEKILVAVRLAE